jgi:peptidoglycan/xylan/chitin deacetylase (PgdA/CDA1 family)
VLWDVITRDYDASLKPEQVERIALKYTRNGSIIVFHDSLKAQKNMQYAFPRAVKQWLSEGYTFATLNK